MCISLFYVKSLEIRLRSGALVSEGRVEVKESDTWGTICDDHWTMREANVVCRSLGYGSAALSAKNAYFGRGIGEVSFLAGSVNVNERLIFESFSFCEF